MWENRKLEGRNAHARKKRRGRTRFKRDAHKIRSDVRARSRPGELVVDTFNVRTLSIKDTNAIGNADMILTTCEDSGCEITRLHEVGRDGQSAFTAAGYVVFCSGADG